MLPFFAECTPSQFECSQEAFCLPQSYVCDGIEDCLLPDDEIQCDTSKMMIEIYCAYTFYIPSDNVYKILL